MGSADGPSIRSTDDLHRRNRLKVDRVSCVLSWSSSSETCPFDLKALSTGDKRRSARNRPRTFTTRPTCRALEQNVRKVLGSNFVHS